MRWAGATAAMLFGAVGTTAGAAAADDVTVRVENLRNGSGSVLVAICTAEAFLGPHCLYHGRAKAQTGAAEVMIDGVPPGSYAVQAIHDENDNLELDRNLLGMPREGVGFSRNAPMRMGPPSFSDAAIEIDEHGEPITLSMRYF